MPKLGIGFNEEIKKRYLNYLNNKNGSTKLSSCSYIFLTSKV